MLNWKQSLYIGNLMVAITMTIICMMDYFIGPTETFDNMATIVLVGIISAIISLKTGDYVWDVEEET